MITTQQVKQLLDEKLEGESIFVVDLKVNPGNKIMIFIDGDKGATIADCEDIHRFVESCFDREVEDFELMVSTPGIDHGLQVKRQYQKNLGREVKVSLKDGNELKGMLAEIAGDSIKITSKTREKVEGRKSKQWFERENLIPFESIKLTKVEISFK
jgi:ribosome maturation factor RimP